MRVKKAAYLHCRLQNQEPFHGMKTKCTLAYLIRR